MTKNERDFHNFLLTPEDMEFEGQYNSPVIQGETLDYLKEVQMAEFSATRRLTSEERKNTVVHFFLPDFLFERVWYHPNKNLEYLKQFKAVCSPDFSQYTDMPRAMCIWNHYRKQWLGAWYQKNGIQVIPTVTWSDETSFDYCFDGMPHNSVVAVSSVGCEKSVQARINFKEGFDKMVKVLEPAQIIFYGNKPHWLENTDNIVFVEPAYKGRFKKEENK